MALLSTPVLVAAGAALLYLIFRFISSYLRAARITRAKGCGSCLSLHQWDPILGIDIAVEAAKYARQGRMLQWIRDRHRDVGNTAKGHFLNIKVMATIEPENVKAMLATQFQDFELGHERRDSLKPLLGIGIFTADGKFWEHSRALVRPNFARHQVADLDSFEEHINNLLARIPKDGSTVDLQELFYKLTVDSATEFLFGESVNSLLDSDDNFAEAFTYSQDVCMDRIKMGPLRAVHFDKKYKDSCDHVKSFADRFVRKAISDFESGKIDQEKADGGRYVFLRELARQTQNPIELRDQLLNILLAGRDTTAGLLSNIFHALARHPKVWDKLQDEIATLGDQRPTFEQIKDLKYLKYVINEALRLWPSVPFNAREAVNDTTLPVGGGPDQKSPIYVSKGTTVIYSVYSMHRRKDLFGPDADEFKPERWETIKPGWEYLPFNGGPRICIGQQFALTEASYCTIRMLQTFKKIESRDDRPWAEALTLTLASQHGTLVSLTPR